MIIHLCLNCHKISCNRIAGDDNAYTIIKLLDEAQQATDITNMLQNLSISPLCRKDRQLVLTCIYGYDYEKYLKEKSEG